MPGVCVPRGVRPASPSAPSSPPSPLSTPAPLDDQTALVTRPPHVPVPGTNQNAGRRRRGAEGGGGESESGIWRCVEQGFYVSGAGLRAQGGPRAQILTHAVAADNADGDRSSVAGGAVRGILKGAAKAANAPRYDTCRARTRIGTPHDGGGGPSCTHICMPSVQYGGTSDHGAAPAPAAREPEDGRGRS